VYELWKGIGYAPEKTDVILKWSPKKPMLLIKAIIDNEWQSNKEKSVNKKKESTVNLTVVGACKRLGCADTITTTPKGP
jgi:hypothetical protein